MNFQLISFQQLKTSLQAMKNYILGVLPTKVSDLINDSEFTDKDYVDTELAKKQDTLPFATPPAASDIGKALMPSAISNGEVTEWEFGEAGLIDDVQINGTSIVNNGIANIPFADSTNPGVVKVRSANGVQINNSGELGVVYATDLQLKEADAYYRTISPAIQHKAVFYGLAKAAGDATQASSDNAVGTYTDNAKSAIKTMIGVEDPVVEDVQVNGTSIISNGVADIPLATSNSYGVVKGNEPYGVSINSSGALYINGSNSTDVKAGTQSYRPLVPMHQHEATFYGLAKAAGADMKDSTNPVGTYTDEAKSAIKEMLGFATPEDVDAVVVNIVTVSGATPAITGVANTRYVCGEVTAITITPPASGTIDVVFTSGSTVAVMTVPNTVKFPAWFDAENLDTNTVYEINIMDGVYGAVMSWPV